MGKGRKPNTEVVDEVQALEAVNERNAAYELEVAEIDRLFLPEGETYNLHIVMERAKFYQEQTANSFIELGKQLILLKNHEEHGQFMVAVEQLGMAHSSVKYAMAAARKFSNSHTCGYLGNAKIRALTVLDDDSIKTLEDSGALEGIGTLDEIEKMTVRELKSALRAEKKKRKEERETQEAAISKKEEKINELEQELRYRQPPTQEELARAKLEEIQPQLVTAVLTALNAAHDALILFNRAQRVEGVSVDLLMPIAEITGGHVGSIQETLETLTDYLDNPCPIKETVPCIDNM